MGNPLGEHRFRRQDAIRLLLWKVDHRFLGPPQIEWRPLPFHSLLDGLRVRIGVLVEKLQKEGEVARVPLVRRSGQQQYIVRLVAQKLAEPVPLALMRCITRRHAVRLIDDH